MAEEEVKKEGTEEEDKPKKSKLKLIIIIVIALIVLGGGGFVAYMMFFKKSPAPPPPQQNVQGSSSQAQQTQAPPVAKKNAKILPQIELQPFIVNLADRGTRRYLKLKVALELSDEKLKDEIEKRKPEIRDIITLLLSSKTYADLSTLDGKLALKTAIMNRLNAVLVSGRVTNVFFVDFVIQ